MQNVHLGTSPPRFTVGSTIVARGIFLYIFWFYYLLKSQRRGRGQGRASLASCIRIPLGLPDGQYFCVHYNDLHLGAEICTSYTPYTILGGDASDLLKTCGFLIYKCHFIFPLSNMHRLGKSIFCGQCLFRFTQQQADLRFFLTFELWAFLPTVCHWQ